MLIYSTSFRVSPTVAHPHDEVVKSVAFWLRPKVGFRGHLDLTHGRRHAFGNGHRIESWSTVPEFEDLPAITSIRYDHPDATVSGRLWRTEIGVRRSDAASPLDVSVLLRVEDVSPRVAASNPPEVSRPGVVRMLLQRCVPIAGTPGVQADLVGSADARRVHEFIRDPARQAPIVLVSPDDFTERARVDVEALVDQVMGLAHVLVIRSKYETFAFTKELGRALSAFKGAINILYPAPRGASFIPADLLTPDRLTEMEGEELTVERQVLGLIVHRMNLPNSWKHVGPEDVRRARLERNLAASRAGGAFDAAAEQYLDELADELESKTLALAELQEDLLASEARAVKLEADKQALLYQLKQLSSRDRDADSERPARQITSLEDIAETVETEMGERVLLTNRGRKSLRDSPFRDVEAAWSAFELLHDHLHQMFKGERALEEVLDEARSRGVEYESHMSEITLGRYPDYNAQYKGRAADFNKHLKVGHRSSRDPERCMRIHFEWDEDDELIVVHHAGRHPENTLS